MFFPPKAAGLALRFTHLFAARGRVSHDHQPEQQHCGARNAHFQIRLIHIHTSIYSLMCVLPHILLSPLQQQSHRVQTKTPAKSVKFDSVCGASKRGKVDGPHQQREPIDESTYEVFYNESQRQEYLRREYTDTCLATRVARWLWREADEDQYFGAFVTTMSILPRPWLLYYFFFYAAEPEEIVKAYGVQGAERPRLRKMLQEGYRIHLVVFTEKTLRFLTPNLQNAIKAKLESAKSAGGLFNTYASASDLTVEVDQIDGLETALKALKRLHRRSRTLSKAFLIATITQCPAEEARPQNINGDALPSMLTQYTWISTARGAEGRWFSMQIMEKSDKGHPKRRSSCAAVLLAAALRGVAVSHPVAGKASVFYSPTGQVQTHSEYSTQSWANESSHLKRDG